MGVSGPPRGAHPRVLVAAAAQSLGTQPLVDWCHRLAVGEERPDDPDLAWLGGTDDWPRYWRRVWGLRALLYLETPAATSEPTLVVLEQGVSDQHWRVREMAVKVIRRHLLRDLTGEVHAACADDHRRVRAAAERTATALGSATVQSGEDERPS